MMTALQRQKAEACKRASDEINPIKSRLMELARDLLADNALGAASELDRITGRLEAWQAKHAR